MFFGTYSIARNTFSINEGNIFITIILTYPRIFISILVFVLNVEENKFILLPKKYLS